MKTKKTATTTRTTMTTKIKYGDVDDASDDGRDNDNVVLMYYALHVRKAG